MTERETIGQRLRRERLARGWTLAYVAERAMIGSPHLSKIEHDTERASVQTLEALANVFGLDPDELFLVALRVPESILDRFARHPREALQFLRAFNPDI